MSEGGASESTGAFGSGIRGLSLLAGIILVDILLLAAHMLVSAGRDPGQGFWVSMFDLGSEANVPTWWASILWLSASCACFLAGRADRRSARRWYQIWWLIGAVLLFASMDEVATIHEEVGSFLGRQSRIGLWWKFLPEGSPGSPWILFYSPFLLSFGALSSAFILGRLRAAPSGRLLFVLSLQCYLLAIGMDYFQGAAEAGQAVSVFGATMNGDALVDATIAAEETLENLGTSMLFASVLAYLLAAGPGSGSRGDPEAGPARAR